MVDYVLDENDPNYESDLEIFQSVVEPYLDSHDDSRTEGIEKFDIQIGGQPFYFLTLPLYLHTSSSKEIEIEHGFTLCITFTTIEI